MKILGNIWVRVLLSLGLLLVLALWLVDLPAAGRALASCDWWWLLALGIWLTLDRFLMAYKWRLLLTCRGMDLSHGQSIRVYYLASFAGAFLPVTVGADALRVGAVAGPGRPSEAVAASVVVERALGFVASALVALGSLSLLMSISQELPDQALWFTVGCLVLGGLTVGLSLTSWADRFVQRMSRRGSNHSRVLAWLGRFLTAYSAYRRHRGVLLAFLGLSVLEQMAPVGVAWMAARALGMNLSLLQAAAVVPVAILFARAPVSLSGFGVVEGLYVAFFSLVGLGSTQAFLLGLITNLAQLATALPGAWFYLFGGVRGSSQTRPPN